MGLSIGLAIGSGVESKYKKEGKIRPFTEKERKRKETGIMIGIIFLLLGVLSFLMPLLI